MATYKKEYLYLADDIMTECDIYSAEGRKYHTERAIWDTGADTTIISSRIVRELDLQPYRRVASRESVAIQVQTSTLFMCLFLQAIS